MLKFIQTINTEAEPSREIDTNIRTYACVYERKVKSKRNTKAKTKS